MLELFTLAGFVAAAAVLALVVLVVGGLFKLLFHVAMVPFVVVGAVVKALLFVVVAAVGLALAAPLLLGGALVLLVPLAAVAVVLLLPVLGVVALVWAGRKVLATA